MAKDVYVYSTLTDSVAYDTEAGEILIAGGANVPNKHMWTPQGVVTTVTDDALAALKKNRVFQLHMQNGFITIQDKKEDVEKVVADMQGKDSAAPDTEEDLKEVTKKTGTKVKVGKAE